MGHETKFYQTEQLREQNSKIDVRLSASHAPVNFVRDGIDVAIRVGRAPWPRNVVGTPFLADRIGPVCSPSLLKDGNIIDAATASVGQGRREAAFSHGNGSKVRELTLRRNILRDAEVPR